jgi:hypothetical protein
LVSDPEVRGRTGWGYNVDYLVAARLGWIVPPFMRDNKSDDDGDKAVWACEDIARRVALPRDEHRAGLKFARDFWLVAMFLCLLLSGAVITAIGLIDHTLLREAWARGLTGFGGGSMTASAIAAANVSARVRWLDGALATRYAKREVPSPANPKPYDFVIALIAGALAAWALIASH